MSTGKGALVGAAAGPGVGGQLAGGADQAKDDHEEYGKYRRNDDQYRDNVNKQFGPRGL